MTPGLVMLLHQLALGVPLLGFAVDPPVYSANIRNRRHSKLADETAS